MVMMVMVMMADWQYGDDDDGGDDGDGGCSGDVDSL